MEKLKLKGIDNTTELIDECQKEFQKDFSFLECQQIDFLLQNGLSKAVYNDKEKSFWLFNNEGELVFEYFFKKVEIKEEIKKIKTPKNYHLASEISGSDICKIFEMTEREFVHYYQKRQNEQSKPTQNMELGTLVHCLTLEPSSFNERYVINTFDSFKTKEAQQWRDSQTKIIINQSVYDTALEMSLQFSRDKFINSVIESAGFVEKELYGVINEVPVRGKLDRLSKVKGGYLLCDFKTTSDLKSFNKSFSDYKLYMKMALYRELCEQNNIKVTKVFLFVVSSQAPFDYEIFNISDDILQLGTYEFQDGIAQIKKALEQNETKEIKQIELSSWVQKQLTQKYFN